MHAAAELERNPVSKHQIQRGLGLPDPSRETKFSAGANADREILIFPLQLTTSKIGNLTGLIDTLAVCVTIHTTTVHPALHSRNIRKPSKTDSQQVFTTSTQCVSLCDRRQGPHHILSSLLSRYCIE